MLLYVFVNNDAAGIITQITYVLSVRKPSRFAFIGRFVW